MSLFFRLFAFPILFSLAFFSAFEAACPSNISQGEWETLTPYFLPANHPAKEKLDELFKNKEVLKTSKTLKKAGFKTYGARGYSKTLILKHKKLKKYLVKAYTDDQPIVGEWQIFMRRIEGSYAVKSAIERLKLAHFFKVPQKWLYQVSRSGESLNEKNFVLVVEDMEVYDPRGNNILWNSLDFVTKEKLDGLYAIFKQVGLMDSIYIDNIPFCLDGKIAFVDTEHFYKWPVPFHRLTGNLAKKMQVHWMSLIANDP